MEKLDGETKKLMVEFARHCMLKLLTEYPPSTNSIYPEVSAQNISKISKILNEYT